MKFQPHQLLLTLFSCVSSRVFLQIIILIAAIVAIAVVDYSDFIVIVVMLLCNATLGFHEDYKCKKSLDELSASLESEIAIRREGKTEALPVKECLPGDIVLP